MEQETSPLVEGIVKMQLNISIYKIFFLSVLWNSYPTRLAGSVVVEFVFRAEISSALTGKYF